MLSGGTAFGQDWAKERLEKSPRHLEWIKLKHGEREVSAFVGFPESSEKATAVVVIHEIFGLTDWVRTVVDQLAEAGYIAIAPDMLSGMAPGGGGTAEIGSGDDVRKAIRALPPEQVTADLAAAVKHVEELPACNGKVVMAGFCWGGSETFRFATNSNRIAGAFVFYGTAPEDKEALMRIKCPVFGFYAENDARVNATVPDTAQRMREAEKKYDPVTYEGAGHGFMRAGAAPDADEANRQAREKSWERWKRLLGEL